jgi:hypothetical protein
MLTGAAGVGGLACGNEGGCFAGGVCATAFEVVVLGGGVTLVGAAGGGWLGWAILLAGPM